MKDFFLRLRVNSIRNENSSFWIMRERTAYIKTPIAISTESIRSFNIDWALGSKNVALKAYTAIPITPDTKNSLITDDNIFRPPINPTRFLSK